MLILIALCSCRGRSGGDAGNWEGRSLGSAPVYPLSDGSVEFTWWYPIDSRVLQYMKSYAENPAFQEIQKKTGIKIKFIHPPVSNTEENFNLMIASGDLPDLIQTANRYPGGEIKAWEDGVYHELTPWMEKCAPDYYRLIHSREDVEKQAYKTGKKLLAFYKLCFDPLIPFLRPILRADWLEEFGMDAPRTFDDFEKYFQAIQAKKHGVTPFFIDFSAAGQQNIFMSPFNMNPSWYQIDNKIQAYFDAPEYKNFLERMQNWFVKGYLSKDVASMKLAQAFALFDSGKLGGYSESVDATFSRLWGNKNIRMTTTPDPRLYPGQKLHFGDPGYPIGGIPDANAVTTACKNTELAVKFLNFGYTPEGSMIYNYGAEGLTWTMVDGEPRFTDYYLNNPQGMSGGVLSYALRIHFGPKLLRSDMVISKAGTSDAMQLAIYNNRMRWSDDPDIDSAYRLLPGIELTTAERDEYNAIMANVNAYVSEMKLKFIMNAESLDNYDAYIRRLYQLGYPRAKEIYQAAYDRVREQYQD